LFSQESQNKFISEASKKGFASNSEVILDKWMFSIKPKLNLM